MANTVGFNSDFPEIKISNQIAAKAADLIPSMTQTLAKGPAQHVDGIAPKYLSRGKGSHVWDVDGNEYLDMTMGVGPLSLGYCHPVVDAAIKQQLESGITFSLMHPLEVEVAELLQDLIPNAEMVRYSKTGADVTSAAVRLARAYTGKNKVLCCGYHGWHDWYISVTDRNRGIPAAVQEQVFTFNYNDIESVLYAIDEDTACVILEPFVVEEPKSHFLKDLRELCTQKGIVLVFDEMWTGFRIDLGGAQEYFQVQADLACFSKAIANGMPLSVLTGKKEIMSLLDKEVFFYTTFGGEALSLAAAKSVINFMKQYQVTAYLREAGELLKRGLNRILVKTGIDYLQCVGYPCRTMVSIRPAAGDTLLVKSLIQQELIRRGVLWSGFHNISFGHSVEDIDYLISAYADLLPGIHTAVKTNTVASKLKGTPVAPVFRKTGNFNTKPRELQKAE